MKKSKRTFMMVIISVVVIAVIIVANQFIKTDPYKSYQHIETEEILNNDSDDSYYIYFYKTGCPYCEEVEDEIKGYAKAHSTMYFVNMDEESDNFSKFDWDRFHEENDIEIGKVDEDGKITYYEGETKGKYEDSKETDEYGKTKRYKIIEADEEYLETNKKARKGYVYASLETPDIDYYTVTEYQDIVIAGVPTLLHIEDNKITEFYFDSVEIKPFMEEISE